MTESSSSKDRGAAISRKPRTEPRAADPCGVASSPEVRRIVEWYVARMYRVFEGPGAVPFYCDPSQVGAFAVLPSRLAAGDDAAIFQVLITLCMFQALRDVVIMKRQRCLPIAAVEMVTNAAFLSQAIASHGCKALLSVDAFEGGCDVTKDAGIADCQQERGAECHVKKGTEIFNRMGDMGKMPTSAWLRFWRNNGLQRLLSEVCDEVASPSERATRLVDRISRIHRVGRKLATMFVSALSTPSLAPGLTPWFPEIDGTLLVVVDTNVARVVDKLRGKNSPRTYLGREEWVREQAAYIDLRHMCHDLPAYSPRVVQQALYSFASRSNRMARGDLCVGRRTPCEGCARSVCPFV